VSPFRKILSDQENFYFRLAEVQGVDPVAQVVETTIGRVRYDYLVLATGATTNYFGDEQMAKHAIAIKSIDDAIELRNTVLSNFEQALQLGDMEQLNSLLDFVIVGGGPTGVEIAGALSELRTHVFPNDYRELDFKQMDIHLVQSGPTLLKGMSANASEQALASLKKFGVQVWLDARVKSYDGYTATLSTGQQLITRTLIWAAGVTGAPVAGLRPDCLLPGNRYAVDEHSRVQGYENVFAIGDIAAMRTAAHPEGHPMGPSLPCSKAVCWAKTSYACWPASPCSLSTTTTRAPWPPSAATTPWPTFCSSARNTTCRASWPGWPGVWCTWWRSSASATA
jgi:NADH dehydrogenase